MIKILIPDSPEARSILRDLDVYINDDLTPLYEDQLLEAPSGPLPKPAAYIRAAALISAAIFDALSDVGEDFSK
jgi:hypothetical protein